MKLESSSPTVKKGNYISLTSVFLFIAIAAGCSVKVPSTLSPDYYSKPPKTIAIMPPNSDKREAVKVFNRIIYEKLKEKGYKPISTGDRPDIVNVKDNRERIKDIAHLLGADALLFTHIKEWNRKDLKLYVSMEVGAGFELYDGNTGGIIWKSHNRIGDFKVDIERDIVRLSTYRAFEPYAQRVVDVSFSTLPDYRQEEVPEDNSRFYYWLKER